VRVSEALVENTNMKFQMRTGLFLLGATIAAACGDGEKDSDPGNLVEVGGTVSSARAIEPGDICEAGGLQVRTGVDEDDDGALSETEVTGSFNICNGTNGEATDGENGDSGDIGPTGDSGTDGFATVSSTAAAMPGVCPAGGMVVTFGLDENENGSVDSGEETSTATICNGLVGDGACAPVVVVTPLSAGTPCEAGGVQIEFGPDSGDIGAGGAGGAPAGACDGMLDSAEISSTQVLCNGVDGDDGDPGNMGDPGTNGTDGSRMAVRLSNLTAGMICTVGGSLLEVGVDDDEDGILDDGEVDEQHVVCLDGEMP
jgi:hypothetical protein